MNRLYIISLGLFFCSFCACISDRDLERDFAFWQDNTVVFPFFSTWVINGMDTVPCTFNGSLKILNYIDSSGCVACKAQLPLWSDLINTINSFASNQVDFLFFINPKFLTDAQITIQHSSFCFPVCIDISDSLNKLNHFPSDSRFHCFLLDENNKVILIGNPVQNPKIKELYLRTISERLGIDYNPSSSLDSSPEINLGTFPQSESKTAELLVPNNSKSIIQIDSVFTSCECTTASIDKMVVPPSGSANLSVKYTPDGVGEFYREVYVQIKGEDKPLVFKIRGKVE